MTLKLSQVSKLDGIKSWSLEAVSTCPGARDNDGDLVEVCQGCYATEGNYRFPNVKDARTENRRDWQRPNWADRLVAALDNERYFRWFDSGDVYHPMLAAKILDVCRRTPWCQHWIPTRSHKIRRIAEVLDELDTLPNVVVRRSSDRIDEYDPATHGSVVVSDPAAVPEGVTLCRARETPPAKCNGCRACWDKDVATIGYPAHGQGIKRVLRADYFDLEVA
jgi:hypothetical protein